jgi:hypothetical protein
LPGANIPEDVARFLRAQVSSITELEILLFLHDHPLAEWNGKALAEMVAIGQDGAEAILRKLHQQGVLTMRERPSRLYQYAPAPPALALTIDRVAEASARQRFAVAAYVLAEGGNEALRAFSNAFRIRPPATNASAAGGAAAGVESGSGNGTREEAP